MPNDAAPDPPRPPRARTWRSAVLVLRWILDVTRVGRLATDHQISSSTAYRYLYEGIDVLARRSARSARVLLAARSAEHPHLDIEVDLWWSGKHPHHGGDVQVVTVPDGWPLRAGAGHTGPLCSLGPPARSRRSGRRRRRPSTRQATRSARRGWRRPRRRSRPRFRRRRPIHYGQPTTATSTGPSHGPVPTSRCPPPGRTRVRPRSGGSRRRRGRRLGPARHTCRSRSPLRAWPSSSTRRLPSATSPWNHTGSPRRDAARAASHTQVTVRTPRRGASVSMAVRVSASYVSRGAPAEAAVRPRRRAAGGVHVLQGQEEGGEIAAERGRMGDPVGTGGAPGDPTQDRPRPRVLRGRRIGGDGLGDRQR